MAEPGPLTDADLDRFEADYAADRPMNRVIRRLTAALREARTENTALGVRVQEAWAKAERMERSRGSWREIAMRCQAGTMRVTEDTITDWLKALRSGHDISFGHAEADGLGAYIDDLRSRLTDAADTMRELIDAKQAANFSMKGDVRSAAVPEIFARYRAAWDRLREAADRLTGEAP